MGGLKNANVSWTGPSDASTIVALKTCLKEAT